MTMKIGSNEHYEFSKRTLELDRESKKTEQKWLIDLFTALV